MAGDGNAMLCTRVKKHVWLYRDKALECGVHQPASDAGSMDKYPLDRQSWGCHDNSWRATGALARSKWRHGQTEKRGSMARKPLHDGVNGSGRMQGKRGRRRGPKVAKLGLLISLRLGLHCCEGQEIVPTDPARFHGRDIGRHGSMISLEAVPKASVHLVGKRQDDDE
jgi:hypothetical protein